MLTRAFATATLLAVVAFAALAGSRSNTVAFVRCYLGTYNEEEASTGALITASVDDSADADSVMVLFIDSLSIPGQAIHTVLGYGTLGEPSNDPCRYRCCKTRWRVDNLLSGRYYLYAVTYRRGVEVSSSEPYQVELRYQEHDVVLLD